MFRLEVVVAVLRLSLVGILEEEQEPKYAELCHGWGYFGLFLPGSQVGRVEIKSGEKNLKRET